MSMPLPKLPSPKTLKSSSTVRRVLAPKVVGAAWEPWVTLRRLVFPQLNHWGVMVMVGCFTKMMTAFLINSIRLHGKGPKIRQRPYRSEFAFRYY